MKTSEYLDLTPENRHVTFNFVQKKIENYFNTIAEMNVSKPASKDEILRYLSEIDFNRPMSSIEAIEFISSGLEKFQVHTPHPSYYGLFNPSASTMGVVADTLTAAYNPQLAAWSHSPLPNEIENLLIKEFGKLFFQKTEVDGTFTSGGAEANHTAILVALTHQFPEFQKCGVQGIPSRPLLYLSTESHHSFLKAARFCGLGSDSVRIIKVDDDLRMRPDELTHQIEADKANGFTPFLIVGTLGTTSSGTIDSLKDLQSIAKEEKLWFHIDAAWGGAIALLPEYSSFLTGLLNADSITFDAHKWLSLPMGASMFLTSHSKIMQIAFGIDTAYMPVKNITNVTNPFHHSIQWSRRFIGLKLFLSLAVAGWEGYREVLRHMIRMGNYLKECLILDGWFVVNNSILPVACFAFTPKPTMDNLPELDNICNRLVESGNAWISTTILNGNIPVLRACITNYRTEKPDIDKLMLHLRNMKKK